MSGDYSENSVAGNIEYMRAKIENIEKDLDSFGVMQERLVIVAEKLAQTQEAMADYHKATEKRLDKHEQVMAEHSRDIAEQKKFMFKCVGGAALLSAVLSGLVAVTRLSDFVSLG